MLKNKRLLFIIPVLITLLAACRAPLPTVSPSDSFSETVVPSQATTPTPTRTFLPTPTPVRTPTPTPPPLSWEQLQKMEEGLHKAYTPPAKLFDSEVNYSIQGPTTKGMTITIAGKKVKLPDDAYIEYYVTEGIPSPGARMPDLPLYVIARGKSMISVSRGSGKIDREIVALGEEGTFNFLKEALK